MIARPNFHVGSEPKMRPCASCETDTYGNICDPCDWTERRAERLREMGKIRERVPAAFRWASLASPDLPRRIRPADAASAARAALERSRVTLGGKAGSGKTSLVAAMVNAIVEGAESIPAPTTPHPAPSTAPGGRPVFQRHRDGTMEVNEAARLRALGVRWFSAYDLANARVRAGLGHEAPSVELALSAGTLIIDDLGTEPKIHNSAIPEILYERHAHEKQTWVTTGYGLAQLSERYGDGIARRLFEDAAVIRMDGWGR